MNRSELLKAWKELSPEHQQKVKQWCLDNTEMEREVFDLCETTIDDDELYALPRFFAGNVIDSNFGDKYSMFCSCCDEWLLDVEFDVGENYMVLEHAVRKHLKEIIGECV